MKTRCTITLMLLLLTACETPAAQYEKQPPFDYNMNCKQIVKALDQARITLDKVKVERETITSNDVGAFIMTLGTPNSAGTIAQKAAEERVTMLESAAISRRCTITQ